MSEKPKTPSPPQGPPGMGNMMQGAKASDFKGAMLKLMNYMQPYKNKILLVFIVAIVSTVFSIVGPKILGNITNKLIDGLIAHGMQTGLLTDFKYMYDNTMLLVGLYVLSFICSTAQGYIMSGIAMKVVYHLRKELSEKINRMPLNYFDTNTHGDILSRITNDVDTISQTLAQNLVQLVTSITSVLGILCMMLSISVLLTAAALFVLPVTALLMGVVVKASQKYFKEQQSYIGKLNGHIEEYYSGHTVMKAFNGEKRSVETFNKHNDGLYESAWKSQFLSGLMMPIMMFVSNLSFVVVCMLGAWQVARGDIKVGDVQAFIQYVRSFNQPISQLANISNTIQSTAAAAERVFEFLEQEEEIPENPTEIPMGQIQGRVEFKNVKFGYNPEKTIITSFTETVEPGMRVAIVGPTGAGKTTMIKLLMRFYDINKGAILIDGHDIRDISRSNLRSMFGMVLQDTWLYNGTIMENIRYGKFDASDDEVIEAAKAAHVDEFVHALPDGYNLVLNEDASNISQGQKQLLTIARAILKDPKILILDEATSSVDTRTEILIQKAMDALMVGRTSFVIAHRLSTVRDSDLILVMKDGDIIEQGNHDELLKQKGFYATLYNSQFEE